MSVSLDYRRCTPPYSDTLMTRVDGACRARRQAARASRAGWERNTDENLTARPAQTQRRQMDEVGPLLTTTGDQDEEANRNESLFEAGAITKPIPSTPSSLTPSPAVPPRHGVPGRRGRGLTGLFGRRRRVPPLPFGPAAVLVVPPSGGYLRLRRQLQRHGLRGTKTSQTRRR